MPKPEYMRMRLKLISDEIIQEYKLLSIASDGWVYIKIAKGIYGLPQAASRKPQAGKLANGLLKKRLATVGYYSCQYTTGLWRHKWQPVS